MEALIQARSLYAEQHTQSLTSKPQNLDDDIQRFIAIALKECSLEQLFANQCMLQVLQISLKQRALSKEDLNPVINAFESLQQYILLLVDQPWKPEYKKLKMYGGFYRTRIKSVLLSPEEIFYAAGYLQTDKEILTYEKVTNKQVLLILAFDCKIAAEECRTLVEEFDKVKHIGKTLSYVICKKLGLKELEDPKLDGTNQNSQVVNPIVPVNGNSNIDRHWSSNSVNGKYDDLYRNKLSNIEQVKFPILNSDVSNSVLQLSAEEKIPELPQGTLEDHLKQSLSVFPPEMPNRSPIHRSKPPQLQPENTHELFSAPESRSTPAKLGTPLHHSFNGNSVSIDEGLPPSLRESSQNYSLNQPAQFDDRGQRPFKHTLPNPLNQSNTIRGAPPIPSRALKPTFTSLRDPQYTSVQSSPSLRDPQYTSVQSSPSLRDPQYTSSQSIQLSNKAIYGNVNQNASMPSTKVAPSPVSSQENYLRPKQVDILRGKSSSLKHGDNRSPALLQVAHARTARSMEIPTNLLMEEMKPKPCRKCTFENPPNSRSCKCCNSFL